MTKTTTVTKGLRPALREALESRGVQPAKITAVVATVAEHFVPSFTVNGQLDAHAVDRYADQIAGLPGYRKAEPDTKTLTRGAAGLAEAKRRFGTGHVTR